LPASLTANGASAQFSMTPSDGIPRTYLVHIPKFYDINKASPVIFAFHGNQGLAGDIEKQTRLDDSTLNPYAIAIYVQGVGTPTGWESNPAYGVSGTTAPNNQQRDVDFVKQLIPQVQNMFCIDSTRIFATGHSNGGGFTGVIACDPSLSATFAAIAANSGAFYSYTLAGADPNTVDTNTPTQQICSPAKNMPIFEAHGTGDPTINYYGGDRNGRTLPTLPRWMNAWATRQGVSINNYTCTMG
jgi:poly(3-hydroxybutyrate) depolymerase